MSVVETVVDAERCVGCGVCAGMCQQNALAIRIATNGDLSAVRGRGTCREDCKVCLAVCPFESGVHDPRSVNRELFGSAPQCNEDVGRYERCVVGHRADEALRWASASGGLATWCLEELLRRKVVTRTAVVRWAGKRTDRQLFEYRVAASPEEVRAAAGSVYYPVEASSLVREVLETAGQTWAVVGVPCLCAALRRSGALRRRVPYVLGLACGMYQNTFYTEMLAQRSGISLQELSGVRYRCKRGSARANDYGFVAYGADGAAGKVLNYEGLPSFLGRSGFFRQNACNYCMDVFAEAADACFMDAWLPEYEREPRGTSLVVIRSRALSEVFSEGAASGLVAVREVGADAVARSQHVHVRRKRVLIGMRVGLGAQGKRSWSVLDELDWKLQRLVQERSKSKWAQMGRGSGGERAFWRAMLPWRLLSSGRDFARRLGGYWARASRTLRT